MPRTAAIKSLFVQNTSQGYKLLGLGLLSLVLMFADSRFDYLSRLRYYTGVVVTPLHYVASLPVRAFEGMLGSVRARDDLAAENEGLREQLLMQQYQLQRLEYLQAENERLNALLKASAIVEEEVVRVQLIGVSPDPFAKRILINKGSLEGVYLGQSVIDAYGLMGQVVEVQPLSSWVLLITDPQHGTPVQVNRNGVRAIAYGTRDNFHQLTLGDVPNTADIKEGDLLFTSGLGQKFPPGYLVGVVTSIYHDPGKPFADVIATPTAQIDRSRNLLLVFGNRGQPVAPPAPDEAVVPNGAVDDITGVGAAATEALAPDATATVGAGAEPPQAGAAPEVQVVAPPDAIEVAPVATQADAAPADTGPAEAATPAGQTAVDAGATPPASATTEAN